MQHSDRDHGGNLDQAIARFGGVRANWLDLSTGINPVPYPLPDLPPDAWTALPDQHAVDALVRAAREFWAVPEGAGVLPVPGASAAIAQLPLLAPAGRVSIPGPTYNEHAASFQAAHWTVTDHGTRADASVHVHPNNPDGRLWRAQDLTGDLRIVDESFCDVTPESTLMGIADQPGTMILKSFGKFWGLAGLRLGFVIGDPALLAPLAQKLGPWPVSGPALHIGQAALNDQGWADQTRNRLAKDAARLDHRMTAKGAKTLGGTTLFRLYDVADALQWQTALARYQVWSRSFPYNARWLRLGLPDAAGWAQLEKALA